MLFIDGNFAHTKVIALFIQTFHLAPQHTNMSVKKKITWAYVAEVFNHNNG